MHQTTNLPVIAVITAETFGMVIFVVNAVIVDTTKIIGERKTFRGTVAFLVTCLT